MGKLITLYKYISARLKEPSTHAAIASVLATFHIMYPDAAVTDWLTVLGLVFGSLGIFIKEQPAETKV